MFCMFCIKIYITLCTKLYIMFHGMFCIMLSITLCTMLYITFCIRPTLQYSTMHYYALLCIAMHHGVIVHCHLQTHASQPACDG